MLRACDLKQREVVNVVNAERLGFIYDVDVDFATGKINSIIVPNKSGVLGMFGKKDDYVIPWDCIVAIGPELVLVRLEELDVMRQF